MCECYGSVEMGRKGKKVDLKIYENTNIFKLCHSFLYSGDVCLGLRSALNIQ